MNLPAQHFTLTKPELKNSLAPVDLYYDFNVNVNLDSIMQAHGLSNIGIENGKLTKALSLLLILKMQTLLLSTVPV